MSQEIEPKLDAIGMLREIEDELGCITDQSRDPYQPQFNAHSDGPLGDIVEKIRTFLESNPPADYNGAAVAVCRMLVEDREAAGIDMNDPDDPLAIICRKAQSVVEWDDREFHDEDAAQAETHLAETKCPTCCAMNKIVNQCRCDPNNLPTPVAPSLSELIPIIDAYVGLASGFEDDPDYPGLPDMLALANRHLATLRTVCGLERGEQTANQGISIYVEWLKSHEKHGGMTTVTETRTGTQMHVCRCGFTCVIPM